MTLRRAFCAAAILPGLALAPGAAAAPQPRDGITFAAEPGVLYLPVREVAAGLDWPVRWDAASGRAYLDGRPVPEEHSRSLLDGTRILRVRALEQWGADVRWDAAARTAVIADGERTLRVRRGRKRVIVSRRRQELRAIQGGRVVLRTRASTGRAGHRTPRGSYRAGPLKLPMLRSRLYNNAPMPWSVQVKGHILIHGYPSVPRYAASHGCIRLPLDGGNPARWFYEWVDVGTPIQVVTRG